MSEVRKLAEKAREAAAALAITSTDERNRALLAMADALLARQDEILAANGPTWTPRARRARRRAPRPAGAHAGAHSSAISEALRAVSLLGDPLGEVVEGHTLPNGIELTQVRVPLGRRRR